MTTPKIDTQAPDMRTKMLAEEMLAIAAQLGEAKDPFHTWEVIEAIIEERDGLRDLSAAREAAAAQAVREAAAKVAQDKHDAAAKWAAHYLKAFDGQTDSLLIAQEIAAIPLPDPAAALDRLIAERVREAGNTAWDEAADIMDGYGQHGYAEEFRARICAARGSKEGQS